MKIAYVISDYTNSGGMERILSTKVNYLAGEGYDISIISYVHIDREPFFHFDERIKFYHVDTGIRDRIKSRRKTQVFVDKIEAVLKELKPDITISMASGLGFEVYRCGDGSKKMLESHFPKYKGKVFMTTLERHFWLRFIPNMYRRKQNVRAKMFDYFALLTYEDKKSWRNLENVVVIPNSLSFIPETYSDLSYKRVVTFARITNAKGLDMLADIWADIVTTRPGWKLDIFGDGSESLKKELLQKIRKLGVEDSLSLLPPTEKVMEELQKSSIFVMTSRYEGFGLALTEAMACGVPPVAFACKCGPRDIINEGEDGFLVEVNDKRYFADKLALLMDSEDLRHRMGQNAAKNVLRFSEARVMSRWIELFQSAAARR